MDTYAIEIIKRGRPYPKNLEALADFMVCLEKGYDSGMIKSKMKLINQTFFNYRKQLIDLGMIDKDMKIIETMSTDATRVPFKLHPVFHMGRVATTELTSLLYRALREKEVEDVPSYEILNTFKKHYAGRTDIASKWADTISDAVAVIAVLTDHLEPFITMTDFVPKELTTKAIRGWIDETPK